MRTIERKYLVPFALVTSMFLLWGLANNMTDTLLAAFKRIMSMSDTQTSFIQFAFYGSYFCFALPAALFIRKKSFKAGIIFGLSLYSLGAILFMPAAYAASYGFYLVAIYIMAGGCSVLETSANPYILSMGSPETATRRLNIAQSFNPVGSIIGIMMSKYFILDDISLYSISGTYAALGLILIVILVVMLFAKMPTGRDNGQQDGVRESFGRLLANRIYRSAVLLCRRTDRCMEFHHTPCDAGNRLGGSGGECRISDFHNRTLPFTLCIHMADEVDSSRTSVDGRWTAFHGNGAMCGYGMRNRQLPADSPGTGEYVHEPYVPYHIRPRPR